MELKEKVFRALSSKKYQGLNADLVIEQLAKNVKAMRRQIIDALDDLCTEGRLDLLDDDTIAIQNYTGTYQGSRNGGKYILTLDGKKLDVDESRDYLLLHGDKVKYSNYYIDGKPCAVVNDLIGRANASVVASSLGNTALVSVFTKFLIELQFATLLTTVARSSVAPSAG